VARLKPVLRRALIIAVVVRWTLPLTPAQADGFVRDAQTAWREARAYVGAIANHYVNLAPGRRSGKIVASMP
jgi:hypothetical protein